MQREGYLTAFLPVNHRHRQTGASKYTNLGRLWASVSDLFGVIWLLAGVLALLATHCKRRIRILPQGLALCLIAGWQAVLLIHLSPGIPLSPSLHRAGGWESRAKPLLLVAVLRLPGRKFAERSDANFLKYRSGF